MVMYDWYYQFAAAGEADTQRRTARAAVARVTAQREMREKSRGRWVSDDIWLLARVTVGLWDVSYTSFDVQQDDSYTGRGRAAAQDVTEAYTYVLYKGYKLAPPGGRTHLHEVYESSQPREQ